MLGYNRTESMISYMFYLPRHYGYSVCFGDGIFAEDKVASNFLIGIIAQRYVVKYHLYADDAQVYILLDSNNELNFSSSFNNLEHCIADIRHHHTVLNRKRH